jgi:hypothetical protein
LGGRHHHRQQLAIIWKLPKISPKLNNDGDIVMKSKDRNMRNSGMTLRFVCGCFGMLVFFAEPLFSQQLTEGPIGTIKKEVYVKNTVRNKAPWVWRLDGCPATPS